MSLRDELLGAAAQAVPGYRLLLPPGWDEYRPTESTEADFLKRADAPFRAQNRPDLSAQFRSMLKQAFASMRRTEVLAFYLKLPENDELPLPLSLTVSKRTAPDGGILDPQVAELIREHEAQPLNDDRSMLRWEKGNTHVFGGQRIATRTVSYLTPVPGTARRQALQFAVVVPHPFGMDPEGTPLEQYIFIGDVIMSTFAWEPQP